MLNTVFSFKKIILSSGVSALKHKVAVLICVLLFSPFSLASSDLPKELYEGMIKFEINSGNYFRALVLMDENYRKNNPVSYAKALWGFHVHESAKTIFDKQFANNSKNPLKSHELFAISEYYYDNDDCVNSLKAMKTLKNKLDLDDKQKRAFYASNCFIKLGSDARAAKVLQDILGGKWAAYAYYNLALSYASGSRDNTKALASLGIATSLNGKKGRQEEALNDKIHLATASLYIESNKHQQAIEVLKKVRLDSESSVDGLYLHGLAHLELGDFRSANQSWVAAKKYSLVSDGAAESLLAIPYAFERSGYVSQSLEAYLEASSAFENEVKLIKKVIAAIKKHGVKKVLIEENDIKGLEWFLANDIALNTTRAAYYSYIVADNEIYDRVELHSELSLLLQSVSYWERQLNVFAKALKVKQSGFEKNKVGFNKKKIKQDIASLDAKLSAISSSSVLSDGVKRTLQLESVNQGIELVNKRLDRLASKISKGKKDLSKNINTGEGYQKEIRSVRKKVSELIKSNDELLSKDVVLRLEGLQERMVANYERAEQGLIEIFQGIAENKTRKKKKKVRK